MKNAVLYIAVMLSRSIFAWELPSDLLAPPAVGHFETRALSPTTLELSLITTENSGAHPTVWNFTDTAGNLHLPAAGKFIVTVNGTNLPVRSVGLRRRVVYAPLQPRDLRIENCIFLQLQSAVADGQKLEVALPSDLQKGIESVGNGRVSVSLDPMRFSPVIHVNQAGYVPEFPKVARIGFYLGSAGELEISESENFQVIDHATGNVVFKGRLKKRGDTGFPGVPPPYQRVFEADFSEFKTPGEYRVAVPGLGTSFPFRIDEGAAAAIARTYALGLYHQRCGTSNVLPFTRFVHGPCHTAPATVPDHSFSDAERFLAESTAEFANDPRHTAPQLKTFAASLYPFVKHGAIDVSGGHHDAGDYSKYTINSAGLVHALVFSADVLPGVGELDNLGIPESGDGKSDVLQEAKWEADFLAKMQDRDGGFYFLVYPRARRYENDVLPDHGDPQIVWPKNTAATAAAVAALAQIASSPLFKKQFPESVPLYRAKALAGWAFLTNALAKYHGDGAYQKLTHYGNDFLHDDEIAWAACELFLLTGDNVFQQKLMTVLDPSDPATRRWGWWRLYESYGRAIRDYAFAVKTGRVTRDAINPLLQGRCEAEVRAAGDDQLRWAQQSAYGTSFPTETKRVAGGGWYFSLDQAFDLAAASALDQPELNDPRAQFLKAIISNLDYEAGCNPVNVCYLTGIGWKRQQQVVQQYAMNDGRALPPAGIPIGNIQAGFMWLDNYKNELRALSFPSDETGNSSYPIYDRWSDSFNVQTEFVAVNQARALGAAAFLMAKTALKSQPWKSAPATIDLQGAKGDAGRAMTASLRVAGLPIADARIVWETKNQPPQYGPTFSFTPGSAWLEAEACWPDGRRAFASTNLSATFRAAR